MTSSNGNIFRVTGHLCGEFTGPGNFPAQRPGTRRFDVFFDLCLNKRLRKQSWGWWFETLSRPLWRHCNVLTCFDFNPNMDKGLYSWSGMASYLKILRSLEAARLGFRLLQQRCCRCACQIWGDISYLHPISRFRDFMRFVSKTSYCLVNRETQDTILGHSWYLPTSLHHRDSYR